VSWNPTEFRRFEAPLATSTQTCRIVTDAGKAFMKALGNRQGPHVLACELVGTRLAQWLGLRTFDIAIMTVQPTDEIPLAVGRLAAPGPAIVTRAERGHPWGGEAKELLNVTNKADIAGLVVFDTWTRNCDRHPPREMGRRPNYDNVFISSERGREIVAMDHSHCFTCNRELNARVSVIEIVQEPLVYGLFEGFRPFVRRDRVEELSERLARFDKDLAMQYVAEIPEEWQVSEGARAALAELIALRADFVGRTIGDALAPTCWPQG
jgi:hypothetical protein